MERANASLISPPDADAPPLTPEGLLRAILAEVRGLRADLRRCGVEGLRLEFNADAADRAASAMDALIARGEAA